MGLRGLFWGHHYFFFYISFTRSTKAVELGGRDVVWSIIEWLRKTKKPEQG